MMKTMELLLSLSKSLGLAFVVMSAASFIWQRRLVYFPSHQKPFLNEERSRTLKKIQVKTEDGLELSHFFFEGKKNLPLILYFHGNAGGINERAYKFDFLIERGYSVLFFEYRGYSKNPGSPSEKAFLKDAHHIFKWLKETKNRPPEEIILFGESIGSCVSIAAAAEHPVKGIILEGAPSSVREVGQYHYPFLPVRLLLRDTWDSMKRIKNVRSPFLFIHSKNDKIVPFKFGKKLFDAAVSAKKAHWLEVTGHMDNLDDPKARQAVIDFIAGLN